MVGHTILQQPLDSDLIEIEMHESDFGDGPTWGVHHPETVINLTGRQRSQQVASVVHDPVACKKSAS